MKYIISKIAGILLSLPRGIKRSLATSVDVVMCALTVWLAFYLRLGEFVVLSGNSFSAVAVAIGISLPIFFLLGLYNSIFRYGGWPALMTVVQAVAIYGCLYSFIYTFVGISGVPRTIGIIQPVLLLLFVGASRAIAHTWLGDKYRVILNDSLRSKVLIYGAGTAGRQLASAMSNSRDMRVIGFLDDDHRLHGHVLNGKKIYNPIELEKLVKRLNINSVLIAMPSISRQRRNEILTRIKLAHIAVRTLPSMADLVHGNVTVSDLRELDIYDLLGREPVLPNENLLTKNVCNKTVVVTGAGGSIGSELSRQIIKLNPKVLLLVEQSELALYKIHQEIEEKHGLDNFQIIPLLASVQDEARLREIMSTWHPDTVYHAAAYKHVPLVEHNPAAGIKNNLLGTLRTAQAAAANNVSDFVLISTDKAVRPTNIMGASKRLAEMVLQAFAVENHSTRFSMVRFGNVLGSSGSVVPKFRQQIRDGGPITLTHPDITRYFMTIPEASQLVIQAGAMAKGGDVFVLDMGQSVKIMDLACRMIELSGLSVKDEQNLDGDIEIEITGLRPGEKLYEELLIGDNPQPTQHARIMKAHEEFLPWPALEQRLTELMAAVDANDVPHMRTLIQQLVPGYQPEGDVVDWVHLANAHES